MGVGTADDVAAFAEKTRRESSSTYLTDIVACRSLRCASSLWWAVPTRARARGVFRNPRAAAVIGRPSFDCSSGDRPRIGRGAGRLAVHAARARWGSIRGRTRTKNTRPEEGSRAPRASTSSSARRDDDANRCARDGAVCAPRPTRRTTPFPPSVGTAAADDPLPSPRSLAVLQRGVPRGRRGREESHRAGRGSTARSARAPRLVWRTAGSAARRARWPSSRGRCPGRRGGRRASRRPRARWRR